MQHSRVRLWPVLQDIHQLTAPNMYGPHGADSFAGQCGAVFAFAPGDWESAEWMSRRSGEEDISVPSVSRSDTSMSVSYSMQRQRCWSPDRILSLPEYHGLVWFHGQSRAVPVVSPPYFLIPNASASRGPIPTTIPVRPRRRGCVMLRRRLTLPDHDHPGCRCCVRRAADRA